MKTLPPASAQGRTKLDEYVAEVLEMLVSKERYYGTVVGYDQVGTTIFISNGDRMLLAFVDPKHPLKPGDAITFRKDGMRAKDLRKAPPVKPEALAELSQLQSEVIMDPEIEEIEDESESVTTMGAAFKQLEKVSR